MSGQRARTHWRCTLGLPRPPSAPGATPRRAGRSALRGEGAQRGGRFPERGGPSDGGEEGGGEGRDAAACLVRALAALRLARGVHERVQRAGLGEHPARLRTMIGQAAENAESIAAAGLRRRQRRQTSAAAPPTHPRSY
jgi:hypothetical protein